MPRITIPISISVSTLIFGLTSYYSASYSNKNHTKSLILNGTLTSEDGKAYRDGDNVNDSQFITIFVILYGTLLAISTFISKPDSNIFISWSEIGPSGIIQLAAAILLSFFIPGYALVLLLAKKCKISAMLKVLLAFLISMLISGAIGYTLALYLDYAISESKYLVIAIYLVILVAFIIFYPITRHNFKFKSHNAYHLLNHLISYLNTRLFVWVKSKSSELIVFGSLLMLLTVYTYYLFGGITIGDQWLHQGRTLLFLSGSIKEVALSFGDTGYPPLQSAILAILTTLSGVPLVNTYASIAFLNIIFIFAFYFFFSAWMPARVQRTKILACTLLATSSGFGWIYLLDHTVTTQPVVSEKSVLDAIVSTEPFDIFQPTNFFLTAHPEFSTGLIYIALPAGFVLLGLLRANLTSKFTFTMTVTVISVLGILSHYEFYLFIIIATVIPLLFRIRQGNYMYLGFLVAIPIVYLIDITSPGKYYTSIEIFSGFSLLKLSLLFVGLMWMFYLIRQKLYRILHRLLNFLGQFRLGRTKHNSRYSRFHFFTGVLLVSIVCYIYGLSFIILSHLSANDIIIQSAGYGGPYNIPWYLYSLKFGITGIFGLAFVLSYLFKKFEKEVFVFGLIIVIPLFAGPYYDEYRFSKYIMVGMVGFASLLVYKILDSLRRKPVISNIIIAAIITIGSLSSILYIGYNSLILQTQDFVHTLGRRNFPASEMPLFQILHDKMDIGSKRYNILSFPNEYTNFDDGLMAAFQGFSGLPFSIIFQNPLTLNVSNLDAFYHLLDDSGIRYIVIPKSSINKTLGLKEPLQFAIDNFQRVYEDSKYLVLDVPELKSPSSNSSADTALVYNNSQRDETLLPDYSGLELLQYNNSTFNFGEETSFVVIQEGNKSENAILSDNSSSKGVTLWSKVIGPLKRINYVEVEFRILNETIKSDDNVGLKWKEGVNEEYYLSLSKDGLELLQKTSNKDKDSKVIYQNMEVEKQGQHSYKLKLQRLQNSTNIFLDDKLTIQIPRNESSIGSEPISQVGISATNSLVEFGPIKIAKLLERPYSIGTEYSDYYYPVNILALSNSTYDIFMDTDLTSFTKKLLILTFDPSEWDDFTFNRYLEYVSQGGTLVVINSGSDNFKGRFSHLFSLRTNDSNESQTFTRISGLNDKSISVSGLVRRVEMNHSADADVIATYRDKQNRIIAPFAIEKHFSNGGRIILVNSEGYFNSLSNQPRKYFLSLSNISALLNLQSGKALPSETTFEQAKRFIGNPKMSGKISLNSSSLLMFADKNEDNSHEIYSDRILISNKSNNQSRIFDNVTIKDLKLMGRYDITINSTGTLALPSKDSEGEYIGVSIPAKSNMTVNLYPDRSNSAQIVTLNSSSANTIKVDNNSTIKFYKISTAGSQKSIPVLLKSPEVKVIGRIGFNQSNFDPYFSNNDIPLDEEGRLETKINFVDTYKQLYDNGTTKIQSITYLQSINVDPGIKSGDITLNLPGDISHHAKRFGPQIPLKEALLSSTNLILIVSIIIVATIGSRIMWYKIKHQNGRDMPL
jgi:hypothetical protein